jgi:ubiquitin carboxyl-terminal hydrolase 9/13
VLKGPVLELRQENALAYGMGECTFTGLKDIFLALIESQNRTGVLSPQRFLEIFKRDNELFRTSMHQDAHEFYGLVLNDVITNVENNARKQLEAQGPPTQDLNGLSESLGNALSSGLQNQHLNGTRSPGTGWVHDIFEGLLTSETQCLTCGTSSQRDETFLDLSIDLEEHSSVTSCLRKFSDDEVLCERNKFHCDSCGGLQEAEKRMKVRRLPKVLTLHLKRFKYTEDYSALQKLFHRVVYPYHLRMFNTTEDAEHQDRLYELYAVVVHIGGNALHGHYVSIIKTKDRGWVLFDDELVEPVDKHFVRNFFGGEKPGMATAYVLFYQETTFEKVREEQVAEGLEEVRLANRAANVATEDGDKGDKGEPNGLRRQATQPARPAPEPDTTTPLARASTTPAITPSPAEPTKSNDDPIASTAVQTPANVPGTITETPEPTLGLKSEAKSKEDKKREKKEREAAEKEKKAQAKQEDKRRKEERAKEIQARQKDEVSIQKVIEESKKSAAREESARKKENGESSSYGMLSLSKNGGKSMNKRSFSFFNREKGDRDAASGETNGGPAETKEGFASRLSSSLLKKKSSNILTSK